MSIITINTFRITQVQSIASVFKQFHLIEHGQTYI